MVKRTTYETVKTLKSGSQNKLPAVDESCGCFKSACSCYGQSNCNCCYPTCGCAPEKSLAAFYEDVVVPKVEMYPEEFEITETIQVPSMTIVEVSVMEPVEYTVDEKIM